MKITPIVIVDSREQHAWQFENLPSEPGSLTTGDYSIRGLEHLVAVERKSLDDLLGCVGTDRARFKRELQRLRAYRFRALIVEASHEDIQRGQWRSKVHPNAVAGSLAGWMAQYSLPIMLAGDHEAAARFAERYLFQAARCIAQENAALGVTAECVA